MKSRLHLFLLPPLIAGLSLIPAGRATAQTFTTLHSFAGYTGDQAYPYAGLILSGNTLYGTAVAEGSSGNDTVFAVNTDGTGFTNLHSFIGSDRALLYAGLVLLGNTLYGVASEGGDSGEGAVFAVNIHGAGFTNLYNFTNYYNTGAYPYAGLTRSGNALYGTASQGGSHFGSVFTVNRDGTQFTNLHSLAAGNTNSLGSYTNSEGVNPLAGLVLSGNTLYGTAIEGGSSGHGTVFAINTNGTGFTVLHNFTEWTINSSGDYTNSDGVEPTAGLVLSDNTLYGTASGGGSSGLGTVFAIDINGTGFKTLHSFTGIDGESPRAGLVLSGNTLYGTALGGGSSGVGTVFAIHTDGTGFTTLHHFTYGSDGHFPYGALVLSGNTLYGTTSDYLSPPSYGTVFSLSFRPQLTIIPSGPNVILSWPTNVGGFDYTGYTLQSTTNLVSPAVWSTNSPAPVVADGQNTVTIPMAGTRKFYRLSQ